MNRVKFSSFLIHWKARMETAMIFLYLLSGCQLGIWMEKAKKTYVQLKILLKNLDDSCFFHFFSRWGVYVLKEVALYQVIELVSKIDEFEDKCFAYYLCLCLII